MDKFRKKVWKFFKTPITDHVKNLWDILHDFFRSPTQSRWFAIIGIIVVVIALPVTVIVLQQRTIFSQHAYVDCTSDWIQCAGQTNGGSTRYCTNIPSTHQVHVYQPARCNNAPYCVDLGQTPGQCGYCAPVGQSCGVSSDCCGGGNSTFCDRKGVCRNYCNVTTGKACSPGSDYYCDATFNYQHICADTNYTNCQHVDGQCGYHDPNLCSNRGGHCEKYQCNNGEISIGGTCTFGDSACCKAGTPTFTCNKQNDMDTIWFSGTDGSVTYCDSGSYCSGGPVSTNNGTADAKNQLCKKFDPNSCKCTGTTSFSCNNGQINRSCGGGLVCSSQNGAQSGLWPCVSAPTPSYTSCKTSAHGYLCSSQQSVQQICGQYCQKECPLKKGESFDWSKTTCYTTEDSIGNPTGQDYCNCGIKVIPAPTPTTCHGNGYCIHYSPQICPSGDQTISDGSCGSGGFDRCCVPQADPCANVPDTNSANGWYCANATANNFVTNSNDTNHLYDCEHGKTAQTRDCSNLGGCIINQNGNDYCKNDNSGGGGGCTTVKTYNECEQGNDTYCLSHGVPKGHLAEVTQTTCGYSCKDLGSCACTSDKDTKIALSVKLDGIGTGNLENTDPKRPNRSGKVRVFDTGNSNGSVNSSSQAFNYGKSDGKFDSTTIDLGANLHCGSSYKVEVKIPGYLPTTVDIKYGDTSQVITLEPIGGDINQVDNNGVIVGDGKVDINDYSIYRQCRNVDPNTTLDFKSSSTTVKVKCGDLINFFDFQDGGTMENNVFPASGIGEWDANYNLWLRWYLKANGL